MRKFLRVFLGLIIFSQLFFYVNSYADTYVNKPESVDYAYNAKKIDNYVVWDKSNSPYICESGTSAGYYKVGGIVIEDGGTLVIEKGVKLYFLSGSGSIKVEEGGNLLIQGTESEPVVISNHPSREEGNWGTIWFDEGSGGKIENLNMSDAGYESWGFQDWLPNSSIYIYKSLPITIENVEINNSIGYGMRIYESDIEITNVDVLNSTKDAIYLEMYYNSSPYFPHFSNISASGNLRDGIVLSNSSKFVNDTTIYDAGVPYIVGGHIEIVEGKTLDIEEGVLFRFGGWELDDDFHVLVDSGATLNVNGENSNKVIFTSAYDIENGGQIINAEGISERTPLYGDGYADWRGIICLEGSEVNIENAVFKYGGDYDYKSGLSWYGGGMISNRGGTVNISESIFDSPGIAAKSGDGSFPTSQCIYQEKSSMSNTIVDNCEFRNADNAIYIDQDAGKFKINNSTFENISEYGVYNKNSNETVDAKDNWWSDNSGPSGQGSGTGCQVSEYVDYTPFVTYYIWETKYNQPVNKSWKIEFSKDLDSSTITNENFYIKNEEGESVSITLDLLESNKEVLISPENNYDTGKEYILYIKKNVKSVLGSNLNKDIKMNFHIN